MKKILIINPNSSQQMTDDIRHTVSYAQSDRVSIDVVRMEKSPFVLECFSDYTMAGAQVISYLNGLKGQSPFPYDGVLLACMGDPCLYGVKEACPVPLVGIAEAGIAMATLCGAKFSILASSAKAKPMMESMLQQYGMNDRMASVETFDLPIEDFMKDRDLLCRKVKETADSASAKGAEVLLLGCAGMTMISDVLDGLTDIPAIDPIKAGVESLLAMLRGGFKISRAGLYA